MIKRIIIIAVNALCIIGFVVCLSVSASIQSSLRSQQAATAWAGQSGERFAQISVFFPEYHRFDENDLRRVRSNIDDTLLTASLETAPMRRLHTDAWSASTEVSILDNHDMFTVNAMAVGGDFFIFNPMRLRDGSFLSPNDIMHDRIVIDEELAWRLFGAIRVAGFEVYINYRPFVVAGVVARETDFANSRAYTYGASLFMSFDMLTEMTGGEASINTYTIVMPDPISNFAYNAVVSAIQYDNVYMVENNTRFSLENTFARIGTFGERSMRTDAIAFPYWENAARFAEDWIALLLVLALLFIVFPIICAIIYGIILSRILFRLIKATILKKLDEREMRKYKDYALEHGLDPHIYDDEEEDDGEDENDIDDEDN